MGPGIELTRNRKYSFGLISGGVSLAVESLAGIVILPMLLRFLPKIEVGVWIIITSLTGAIMLVQAAFGPIVTRMSAAWLRVEEESRASEDANQYVTIVCSYRFILVIVLLVATILYYTYLKFVIMKIEPNTYREWIWPLVTIGFLARTYSTKNYYIVNGFGEVGWDKIVQICVTTLTVGGYLVVLYLGMGLVGLAGIYLLMQLCGLALSYMLLQNKAPGPYRRGERNYEWRTLKLFLRQVGEIAFLNLVGFIVMNADIYMVERFFGVTVVPYYSGLARIGFLISSVAMLVLQMAYPFIARQWAEREFASAYHWFRMGIKRSVIIGVLLSVAAFISAPIVVPRWLGADGYLGGGIFGWILVYNVVYINHNAHAIPVIATGGNTFVTAAIINAILSITFAALLGQHVGIQGIIIGNMLGTLLPTIYVVRWSSRYFNSKCV